MPGSPHPRRRLPVALLLVNLVYAVLLIVLALMPNPPAPAGIDISDTVAHAAAYGGQALLLSWLLASVWPATAAAVGAFVGAAAFGAVAEVLQLLQPARVAEGRDLLANAVGAALVVVAVWVFRRRRAP